MGHWHGRSALTQENNSGASYAPGLSWEERTLAVPWNAIIQKKLNAADRADDRAAELRAEAAAIELRQASKQDEPDRK